MAMEFSKFDMVILMVMSVGIVVMSFVFPALGLAEAETAESDIPSFEMDEQRFDFAADFPNNPGTPSTGTLTFDTSRAAGLSDNSIWLNEGLNNTQLTLTENASTETAQVNLFLFPLDMSGVLDQDNATLSPVGDAVVLEIDYMDEVEYDVYTELTREEDVTGGTIYAVEYEIRNQPTADEGGGWLDRIPILGGIIDAGETLAGMVGWVGAVLWWFVTSSWEVALNTIGMLFDVVTFLFASASWLATTYGGIVEAADSWVAVFVAIPGLLLSLEFAKLGMIGISLLPFT